MKNIILSVALLATTIISGCDKSPSIKSQLKNQINNDLPQLAVMDAVYLVEFANFKDGFWSDDIYIRKDVANRSYGFTLENVIKSIDIVDKNGKPYLKVTIPRPDKLPGANNKKPVLVLTNNPNYQPQDQKGNIIDIDSELVKKVDEQEQILHKFLIDEAKEKARVYFKLLAKKFDLELDDSDIKFEE